MISQLNFWFRRERWPLLGLLLVWLAFFGPVLSGKYVYFLDDLKIIYYPLEVAYSSFQAAGQLPLWSNFFGFGHPLLSWGQLGFFTPVHLLLRAWSVDPINLLQISVVSYYLVGLLGMYAWLKKEKLTQTASFLGAVTFVFCGFHLGHLNHVNFYTGTMLLPLLLLALSSLLRRPHLRNILGLTLAATAIAVSAQPQIVLYIFLAATVIFISQTFAQIWQQRPARNWYFKFGGGLVLAGILSLCLSSYALLPLAEFLPLTERNDALPESVLFEFSYPPHHAITFLLPYFFGDHDNYWGAKGFQELAGLVGIIPLALAGVALLSRSTPKWLKIAAAGLLIGGFAIALGENFFLYRWLITEKIITALSIPGRFIFFALTGIAILAALGLNNITTRTHSKPHLILKSFWLPGLILLPFFWRSATDSNTALKLRELSLSWDPSIVLVVLGLMALGWLIYQKSKLSTVTTVSVVALTFILLGLPYNPLMSRSEVKGSPLVPYLTPEDSLPAPRLYSREHLLNAPAETDAVASEEIRPSFSVYQPVKVLATRPACWQIPLTKIPGKNGSLTLGFHESLTLPSLAQVNLSSREFLGTADQNICFTDLPAHLTSGFISFTSTVESGITLSFFKQDNEPSAYLVRVENPTFEQILASQKGRRVVLEPDLSPGFHELPLLARHLQATREISSARWIGALSIQPYREFIEFFFANDREPLDGDGNHALAENRSLVDFAGVTHLASLTPAAEQEDQTIAAGYELIATEEWSGFNYNLYHNPNAFPKAFTVDGATFKAPDDEVRLALTADDFDPSTLVYIDGPVPPPAEFLREASLSEARATLTHYSSNQVEVEIEAPRSTWLIVTDSTTPQWQTYLNGQEAPRYIANTIFKAAYVPAGQHTVSFRYHSPAAEQAGWLTRLGLLTTLFLFGVASWHSLRQPVI